MSSGDRCCTRTRAPLGAVDEARRDTSASLDTCTAHRDTMEEGMSNTASKNRPATPPIERRNCGSSSGFLRVM